MTLVGFPPVSDAELMRLSDLNPGWSFERDDEGAIAVSPPTSWRSGRSNVETLRQLCAWVESGAGGLVLESSTGFRMSTKAVRSPDASWVSQSRADAAAETDRGDFFPGAPDVAIEIASPSDTWNDLTAKIAMYVREGSLYAVAIDPARRDVFSMGTAPAGLHLDIEAIIRAGL